MSGSDMTLPRPAGAISAPECIVSNDAPEGDAWMAGSGASQSAIAHHYDLGNEFYGLWLDPTRTYTSARFESDPGRSLHEAQTAKIDHLLAGCGMVPATGRQRLLDIGCGWGGLMKRACDTGTAQAVGLTLSRAQKTFIDAQAWSGVDVQLCDWRDFEPEQPFHLVTSVESIEAFVRQGLTRDEKVRVYRHLFEKCHSWLAPGGSVVLQMICYGNSGPEHFDPFIAKEIFPESDLPRLSEVIQASERLFEPLTLSNDRADYVPTLRRWLNGLIARRSEAVDLVGEQRVADYDTYLRLSIAMFQRGTCDLIRIAFRRIDNPWNSSQTSQL